MNKSALLMLAVFCVGANSSVQSRNYPHKYSDWVKENNPNARVLKQKMNLKKISYSDFQESFASTVGGVGREGKDLVKNYSILHKDYAVILRQSNPSMKINSTDKITVKFKKEGTIKLRQHSQEYQISVYDEKLLNSIIHENIVRNLTQNINVGNIFTEKMNNLVDDLERLQKAKNLQLDLYTDEKSKTSQMSELSNIFSQENNPVDGQSSNIKNVNDKLREIKQLIIARKSEIFSQISVENKTEMVTTLKTEFDSLQSLYNSLINIKAWDSVLDDSKKLDLARKMGIIREMTINIKIVRGWKNALLDPYNLMINFIPSVFNK